MVEYAAPPMANMMTVSLGTDPSSVLPLVAARFWKDLGTFMVSALMKVKNKTLAPVC